MEETFPHLNIQREAPVNEKRPGGTRAPLHRTMYLLMEEGYSES